MEANDGVRLYVNNELIIDNFVDSASDSDIHLPTSTPISLTANEFVPIKVQFYNKVDLAVVVLSWQSSSQSLEVIPSSKLFHLQSS